MTAHRNDQSQDMPDPYRNEKAATAIAFSELVHSGEYDLASYIVDSTDPITLLEGFTNAMQIAVQLLARHGGIAEEDVFDLIRSANNLVEAVPEEPNFGEANAVL
jgi:hypothetical protein